MRRVMVASVVLSLLVIGLPALAEGIAEDSAAGQELARGGKTDEAMPLLQSALKQAAEKGWDKLSGDEMMGVAGAHAMLMAIACQAALKTDALSAEQTGLAKQWRDLMLPSNDLQVISFGEEVQLEDYLVPGKTNIVDFFSKFCGPCVRISPVLERLAEGDEDVVLIKVDINRPGKQGIDWGSPVSRQYKLESIPYMRVYGPDGQLVADGDQARTMVMEMAQKAGL